MKSQKHPWSSQVAVVRYAVQVIHDTDSRCLFDVHLTLGLFLGDLGPGVVRMAKEKKENKNGTKTAIQKPWTNGGRETGTRPGGCQRQRRREKDEKRAGRRRKQASKQRKIKDKAKPFGLWFLRFIISISVSYVSAFTHVPFRKYFVIPYVGKASVCLLCNSWTHLILVDDPSTLNSSLSYFGSRLKRANTTRSGYELTKKESK